MIFADLATGTPVFLDANSLVYHFIPHPAFGAASTALIERIDRKDLMGYTSSHVLGEMAHRLMTTEAGAVFGWPAQGIAVRLRKHPAEVQRLGRYRQALDEI